MALKYLLLYNAVVAHSHIYSTANKIYKRADFFTQDKFSHYVQCFNIVQCTGQIVPSMQPQTIKKMSAMFKV